MPALVLPAKVGAVSVGERGKVCSCDELLKELVLTFSKKILPSHGEVLHFCCGAARSQGSNVGGLDCVVSCGEGPRGFVEVTE